MLLAVNPSCGYSLHLRTYKAAHFDRSDQRLFIQGHSSLHQIGASSGTRKYDIIASQLHVNMAKASLSQVRRGGMPGLSAADMLFEGDVSFTILVWLQAEHTAADYYFDSYAHFGKLQPKLQASKIYWLPVAMRGLA